MNRKQRRNFIKRAKEKGISAEYVDAYLSLVASDDTTEIKVKDGQKVKLDISKIRESKSYANMTEKYKKFVDESCDKVFTACVEDDNFVSLVEAPEWLFWIGDVITEWEK